MSHQFAGTIPHARIVGDLVLFQLLLFSTDCPTLSQSCPQGLVACRIPGSCDEREVDQSCCPRGYGFIHPPETKDVTDKVVWSLDIQNFGNVTPQGIVTYTRTDGCGSGQVNATYNNPPGDPAGSVIVGSAAVSGFNNNTSSCQ
jgi:hypothetical protein